MLQTKKPFRSLTARDLMSKDVLLIPRKASLRHAAHLLAQSRVSGAPVVDDDGRCVGVLSTTDFMRVVEQGLSGFTARAPSTSTVVFTAVAGSGRSVDPLVVWATETVTPVGGSMESDNATKRGPYRRRRRTHASPGWRRWWVGGSPDAASRPKLPEYWVPERRFVGGAWGIMACQRVEGRRKVRVPRCQSRLR